MRADRTFVRYAALSRWPGYCACVGGYDPAPAYPTTSAAEVSSDRPPAKQKTKIVIDQ